MNVEPRKDRHAVWTRLLTFAALLPFCLAVVFYVRGPVAQSSAAGAERPALVFDQYLVNYGPVEAAPYHRAKFVFTNRSQHTVKVQKLEPSCGCLNPRLEKMEYAPGESGEFSLRVQAANEKPGPKDYYCKVLYEDTKPREAMVHFKLELPTETVTVQPKSLTFYQLSPGKTTQTITVTNYLRSDMRIVSVESTIPLAEAILGEVKVDAQGVQHHQIQVVVDEVPPGEHQGMVTIDTDDETFSHLNVPFRIYGSVPETADPARDSHPTR